MPMLEQVRISGFKSIERVELELRNLNVVIGANGSGKSNLIGVFRFLERVVARRLQETVAEAGGADRFLFHGRKRTPVLELGFCYGLNDYELELAPAAGDTLVIRNEVAWYSGFEAVSRFRVQLARGGKESGLSREASQPGKGIAQHVVGNVAAWRVFHFHDTSDSARVKEKADIDDNQELKGDASNLAPFLMALKETSPDNYRHLVQHVQLVAPFFDDFVLVPTKGNARRIKLEWRQVRSKAYFDGYSLSDGTLRFICLAALLLQPALPRLVVIDEPELGLHPFAIRVLADLLRAAATRTQLLLATQSVTLLNQLSVDDVVVAEHDNVRTTFARPDTNALKRWLKSYAVGELWEKNVLGGRPRR